MQNFLCRWPNGDLSIVAARDRNNAIIILDELGDATEAELFETKNLLLDFKLDEQGHLQLQTFGEDLDDEIMEQAYPLLWKARMEDEEDNTDFPEAAAAELLRLAQAEARPTDELAKNIFIARLAADEGVNLATAIKRYKKEGPVLDDAWHDLAEKCAAPSRLTAGAAVHIRDVAAPGELAHYDETDVLPHLLLTAVLAAEMNASMITIWRDVSKHVGKTIGTYWRWMAQQARRLPNASNSRPN